MKHEDDFKKALILKIRYMTTKSREDFANLTELAKNNYWAKRWLADFYKDGQAPIFFGFVIGFQNTRAQQLYLEITQADKNDEYAYFCASITFIRSGSLPHEENALYYAACLAVSDDIEAGLGLKYLTERINRTASESDTLKVTATLFLGIVQNDINLWHKARASNINLFNTWFRVIFQQQHLLSTPFMKNTLETTTTYYKTITEEYTYEKTTTCHKRTTHNKKVTLTYVIPETDERIILSEKIEPLITATDFPNLLALEATEPDYPSIYPQVYNQSARQPETPVAKGYTDILQAIAKDNSNTKLTVATEDSDSPTKNSALISQPTVNLISFEDPLPSATDNLLKEVKEHACSHAEDITTSKASAPSIDPAVSPLGSQQNNSVIEDFFGSLSNEGNQRKTALTC